MVITQCAMIKWKGLVINFKKKITKKKVNQTPGESEQMLGHLENLNTYSALFWKIYKKN
jgi:hypothetical protein